MTGTRYQLAVALFLFLFIPILHAQVGNRISGVITDAETGESLPGAAVQIKGTSRGSVSDLDGTFTISGIRQDRVTLVFSFIGYDPLEKNYIFDRSGEREVEVSLYPSTTELEEVRVTGQADGQVKAMLEQRLAINIKNVVSSEQIQKFPDLNAAEVLQRMPGITLQRDMGEGRFVQLRGTPPELTNFNVNGEQIPSPEGGVRYVGLDVISADQIDFIEVSKVLTPDVDADGIGGTVNVITKKATDEKPDISASTSGGYNNLRQTGNYQVQFSYGQRYKGFGFHMNSSYFEKNQGADNLEYKFVKGTFFGSQEEGVNNYHVQYREVQLRYYDITRARTGLSATLDYEFNPQSRIYLRGMYNSFSDDETRYRKIYELDDALSETYYLYGDVQRDIKDRVKIQDLSTVNFGGEHRLFGGFIDYEAAYAVAREEQPNRLESMFEAPGQAIRIQFDLSDPDYPRAIFPLEEDSLNALAFDEYEMEELKFHSSLITDRNVTAKLNYRIPYRMGGGIGYIKFGGKVRIKNKERDISALEYGTYRTTSRAYPGEGPELSLVTVDAGFLETNLLNQGYVVDHVPGRNKLEEFHRNYREFFIIDRDGSKTKSYGEDYTASENIYAGYAMFRHDIRKLMLLGGLRFEQTDIDYDGRIIDRSSSGYFLGVDTLKDTRTHRFFLPQFQARYAFNNSTNLRAAVTYTYSRPNFEDVLPYREQDRDEVRYGNPDLEFPKSTNFDLLGEKYLREGGILSAGLFYKRIEDFIFYFKRFAHEGDPSIGNFSLMEITMAENGKRAFVYGAEVQAQSKLYFLQGWPGNFGLYFNYTYTYSEAFINKRFPANFRNTVIIFGEENEFSSADEEEILSMPGQAKHTTNVALFYDSPRFYAKLTANYHDEFLYRLGADPDLDEYYGASFHLDFNAHVSITQNLKVFTDVVNLTDAPLTMYLGTPDRIQQREYYSWWARLGIRLNF